MMCRIAFLIIVFAPGWLSAHDDLPEWWPQVAAEANREGYQLISVNAVKKLYETGESFRLIDVRPAYEYADGHLQYATNLEFHMGDQLMLTSEKKNAFMGVLGQDPNGLIIIYCRSYQCLRSGIASHWAVRLGYRNIRRMAAGYMGWQAHEKLHFN